MSIPHIDSTATVTPVPTYDSLKRLASQTVAHHFCDQSIIETCLVPEFVHSIAGQLYTAPLLLAYKVGVKLGYMFLSKMFYNML